jgi:hypothetical protein
MSEYQYYEFQAIDRPLTEEEQQAVSQLSTPSLAGGFRLPLGRLPGESGTDPGSLLRRYAVRRQLGQPPTDVSLPC